MSDWDQKSALPEAMKRFAAVIEATRRPIVAVGFDTVNAALPLESRMSGTPWWPDVLSYPLDALGQPLLLLAQINFAEVPPLELRWGLPHGNTQDVFPRKGLLQLFIGTDDLYGADFDNLRHSEGFRAIYHTDYSQPVRTDFSFLTEREGAQSPLQSPFEARRLTFAPASMTVDPKDYRFRDLLPEMADDFDAIDLYRKAYPSPPIRLGGYASFIQHDPRTTHDPELIGSVSLLTVRSVDGVMWGDSGIAQFLMTPADLRERDFSRVAYHWDCC